jgi:hypothetical protein
MGFASEANSALLRFSRFSRLMAGLENLAPQTILAGCQRAGCPPKRMSSQPERPRAPRSPRCFHPLWRRRTSLGGVTGLARGFQAERGRSGPYPLLSIRLTKIQNISPLWVGSRGQAIRRRRPIGLGRKAFALCWRAQMFMRPWMN